MLQDQWRASAETIYQADAHWCDQVRATRERLAHTCRQCMNRPVRVQTMDGYTYEGTVAGVSGGCLHLAVRDARFFGPAAASAFILPLVLYELLVITLLI